MTGPLLSWKKKSGRFVMNSSVFVISGLDNYVDPPRDFRARRTLHRVAVVLPLMLCDDIHGLLNAFSEICGIARNALCVDRATALLEDGRVLESEDYAKLIREVSLKQTGEEESLDSLIPIRWMLYKAGVLVASLETEFWGAVGGPPPYSDSYTVSVYSEVDITTALEQGIDSLCSKMKWKLRPTIEAKARPRLSIWARLGRLVRWG